MSKYPKVYDENKVGKYPALSKAGGGYVWDEVLEYRVWCHPERGAKDLENGNDYFYVFKDFESAQRFANENDGTEDPLALILQREYINEPKPGHYIHMKEERITEWPVEFLSRPRRDENTLPNFFSKNAPANRLDIIRGLKEGEAFGKEEIFISDVNMQIARTIVVEGDQHTIWAYCMEMVNEEQEFLFDGFICSRGTLVFDSKAVKNFIDKGLSPPLMERYKNEYSICESVSNDDFEIQWEIEKQLVKIFLNEVLYLIMDLKNACSYSKSILKEGPYGIPIGEFSIE